MGLFDIFFSDPVKKWIKNEPFSPKLNLKDLSLNNIKIGDPWEKLEKLGRPDNSNPLKNQSFQYYSSGCTVEIYEGKVDAFSIAVSGEQYDNLIPTKSSLLCDDGELIAINEKSKISTLQPHLGEELEKEVDDEEINFCYETEKALLELDCSLNGIIMRIFVEEKAE